MDPLSDQELKKALSNLEGWAYKNDKIHKEISFENFKEAISFMIRVGFEAEAQGHHPEWLNVYNSVSISLSTHDAGGKVTDKDIKLAKAIDKVSKLY